MPPDALIGDQFEQALEASRRFLLSIANSELPNALRAKGGASDVVQETLTAAHQSCEQFRGETVADLRAWLRSILLNELAAFRRRYADTAARDVSREEPFRAATGITSGTPVAELIRREEVQDLAAAIARLPDEFGQAVVLRVEYDLTFAAIGERLGRTEEAARKLYTRAIGMLRERAHELTE